MARVFGEFLHFLSSLSAFHSISMIVWFLLVQQKLAFFGICGRRFPQNSLFRKCFCVNTKDVDVELMESLSLSRIWRLSSHSCVCMGWSGMLKTTGPERRWVTALSSFTHTYPCSRKNKRAHNQNIMYPRAVKLQKGQKITLKYLRGVHVTSLKLSDLMHTCIHSKLRLLKG